jgi:hypothetical protein
VTLHSSNYPTERFVSLHGFFAFEYPANWSLEADEAGQYVFFNPSGGSGVLRVMLLPNEFEGVDAEKNMLNEVYQQNIDCEPSLYAAGTNRFVHFAKMHDVQGTLFSVYYWASAQVSNVILFTYTIQSAMKNMPVSEFEKSQIETLITTFKWLHKSAAHGDLHE